MAIICLYKPLPKCELAALLEISDSTLRRWLNDLYFDEIEPLGYTKNTKKIPPAVLKYLSEKLCFSVTE